MALVTKIKEGHKNKQSVHKPTTCDFFVFLGSDGGRYLQIDTYGSEYRELTGKVSQSIQFNEQSAGQLKKLIEDSFPNI
jgi:hypothetical protein